jgi:DNA invertase Pin-like site-specific DNA recombinase
MKQKAILYTRVSTEDQNNGYSPSDQKERLLKYCEQQGIEVVGFFHDDESGKSFDRTEWKNLVTFLKKNRGDIDLVLFIKWDRFSRNIADAYITIKELRKYGAEPQAIEQPLNFEIPESKIMLAVYLAAPEVDNDRRALNIFHGIRRAKIQGRWLGGRLYGYKRIRDERDKPILVPEGGKQEQLVKDAFKWFATGLFPVDVLRKRMNEAGMKLSRNSFWDLLRNKGYIGLVNVPAYKDEPEIWVKGQHPAIIDENTFYTVQDVMAGRAKKNQPLKYSAVRDELPLRGSLLCPKCGKVLTGSGSRGRHGSRFYYYHCSNGCKERQKAGELNNQFLEVLRKFKADPEVLELYGTILKQRLKMDNKQVNDRLLEISKEIERNEQRLKNARALMLDAEIKADEYREMKIDIENNLYSLKIEQMRLKDSTANYDGKIDFIISLLKNIDKVYTAVDTGVKRLIIGSIFPQRLVFENNKYRTPKLNEAILAISGNSKRFRGAKKGKNAFSDVLSCQVESEGFVTTAKNRSCLIFQKVRIFGYPNLPPRI